jgi:hypothetical protein|eukprot:COSAG06_NODE_5684_length_3323_cov_2.423697_3_plen_64_part_00
MFAKTGSGQTWGHSLKNGVSAGGSDRAGDDSTERCVRGFRQHKFQPVSDWQRDLAGVGRLVDG